MIWYIWRFGLQSQFSILLINSNPRIRNWKPWIWPRFMRFLLKNNLQGYVERFRVHRDSVGYPKYLALIQTLRNEEM